MKRILLLICICVAMFCGLVGCSGKAPSEATVSTDSAPTFSEVSVSDSDTAESTLTDTQTDEVNTKSSDSTQTTDEISASDSDTAEATSTDAQIDEKNTESTTIEIHIHSYTNTVVAPTCTKKGYTLYECSCGESYKDSYIDAIAHVFGGWVSTKEATATEKGERIRTCLYCPKQEVEDVGFVRPIGCENRGIDVYRVQQSALEYVSTLKNAVADPTIIGVDRGGMAGWTLRISTFPYDTEEQLIARAKEGLLSQYEGCMQSRSSVKLHLWIDNHPQYDGEYFLYILYQYT